MFKNKNLHWSLDTKDSITFHHRIDIIRDSIILVNIRKADTVKGQTVRNEGYASFDLQTGNLIHSWWINDHLDELGRLADFDGSVLLKKDQTNKGEVSAKDFWHINDVTMFMNSPNSGGVLRKGDVILSLRNLNTFIIVRDNKIFKSYQGNFRKQHDVDIIDANTVSIFNNNASDNGYPWEESFCGGVVYYNLQNQSDSTAYTELGINTYFEGQYHRVGNYELIENQNQNEIIILNNGSVVFRGETFNSKDSSKVNLLNWTQIYFK